MTAFARSAAQAADPSSPNVRAIAATAKAAGDPLRANVLRVLCHESFSVRELCQLFDTAQPAMSHHLKVLHRAGLLARRREGNSIFYRRASANDHAPSIRESLFRCLDAIPLDSQIARRVNAVHDERRRVSERFFQENAAKFEDSQARISSAAAYAPAVLELAARTAGRGTLLEVGPGDGELLTALSDAFDQVVAIDSSEAMLARTRAATAELANVTLLLAPFDALPVGTQFDVIVAAMVVHHMPSPARFFQHAAAALAPGGRLIVAELEPHDQEWVREACGDLWLGIAGDDLTRWAARAGLSHETTQNLTQNNGFQIHVSGYALVNPTSNIDTPGNPA